jgi:hypothetical protein
MVCFSAWTKSSPFFRVDIVESNEDDVVIQQDKVFRTAGTSSRRMTLSSARTKSSASPGLCPGTRQSRSEAEDEVPVLDYVIRRAAYFQFSAFAPAFALQMTPLRGRPVHYSASPLYRFSTLPLRGRMDGWTDGRK